MVIAEMPKGSLVAEAASTTNSGDKTDRITIFKRLTSKMTNTYMAKNHDYGGSFAHTMEEFGLIAPTIRLSDKLERVKQYATLPEHEMRVKDESLKDTLLDLANYAIMTIVELEYNK